MSWPIVVLRPEPGASITADKIDELGLKATKIPLFALRPVAWFPPAPDEHDALLLTSANAARLAGDRLTALRGLPTFAVGAATAEAARRAGLNVVLIGRHDGRALAAEAATRGVRRGLLLCGRDHILEVGEPISRVIVVYASDAVSIDRDRLMAIEGAVALLHSARAANQLSDLADALALSRANVRLAALSSAVAHTAGGGWGAVAIAQHPTDDDLLITARRLAD